MLNKKRRESTAKYFFIFSAVIIICISFLWSPSILYASNDTYFLNDTTLSDKVEEDESLPEAYDARKLGIVTSVKDQGKFNTCWAYGAVACAESNMLIKKLATLEEADFSERHLAYFVFNIPKDPLGNAVGDKEVLTGERDYMIGAGMKMAVFSLANWIGFAPESAAPYPKNDEVPEPVDEELAYLSQVHLKHAYWLPADEIEQIKRMILKYGVAEANSYVGKELSNYYNKDTYAYYCSLAKVNHSIMIVGWDDNYPAENFKDSCRPSSDGAWLARNHWGDNWGDNGYFWISYEDKAMRAGEVSFLEVDRPKYQYNYHYDGAVGMNYGTFANGSSFANIFKAGAGTTGQELLQAIGVAVGTPGARYSIQIYKDLKDRTNPESGIPAFRTPQQGNIPYAGYHTIPLKKSVTLESGELFSIVITLEQDSGKNVFFYVDQSTQICAMKEDKMYCWCEIKTSESIGESFFRQNVSESWQDYALCEEPGTLRIKGFTSEAGSAEEMSISLERDSIKLLVQDKKRFKLKTFKISGAKNILIEWKTSDEKVASIKGLGIVEALSPGKCVITASSENGGEASCTVTILARPVKVEGLQCVNAASTAARIQWEKQPDISGYIVFRYNEVTKQWNEIKRIKSWEKNIYVDKGLTPGNSYWYAVRAYSDAEKEVLAESSELLYVTTKK